MNAILRSPPLVFHPLDLEGRLRQIRRQNADVEVLLSNRHGTVIVRVPARSWLLDAAALATMFAPEGLRGDAHTEICMMALGAEGDRWEFVP